MYKATAFRIVYRSSRFAKEVSNILFRWQRNNAPPAQGRGRDRVRGWVSGLLV